MKFVWPLLFVFLVGCASIDTTNKRIAAMEITYQEIMKTAILYKREGRLSPAQIKEINALFNTIDQSRDLILMAMNAKNDALARDQLISINAALGALRTILLEIEGERETTSLGHDERHAQRLGAYSAVACNGRT